MQDNADAKINIALNRFNALGLGVIPIIVSTKISLLLCPTLYFPYINMLVDKGLFCLSMIEV